MRKIPTVAAALAAAATVTSAALAAGPVPFPATQVGPVFIAANTVQPDGSATNYVAPGSAVVFRAYAVDEKTKTVLTAKQVKYFYVAIPGQPSLKLKYDGKAPGATVQQPWSAVWNVPAGFQPGVVQFKVLVQTKTRLRGSFVQLPVSSAQLTVSATPPAYPSGAPVAAAAAGTSKDVSLYVDSVNGSSPVGVPRRPVGCSQTNVYRRGEQVVFRAWGSVTGDATVLSTDNVDTATATIPGQAPLKLNWSPHGAAGSQVYFWSAPWVVPASFPLGDVTVRMTFKTDTGKTGTYDYALTIIP